MFQIRNLIVALSVLVNCFAFAAAPVQPLKLEQQDLTDYLTPADIMREFGINPDGVLWNVSYENPRLIVLVDKAEKGTSSTAQTLEAILDGETIAKYKVSTAKEEKVTTPDGKTYFATTPTGTYRITWRDRYHKSAKWNGAEMNFAQFFIGGIAIHATVPMHYDALGSRDSGGCVRLHPTNAEKMWNLVNEIGEKDVKIVVYDGSEQSRPNVGGTVAVQPKPPVQKPLPTPKPTPKPAPKPQPAPPQYHPQPQPQYPPQYQPQPYPQYPPQYPPQYQPQQPVYPPQWKPSAQPTPPPPPPPGYYDSYPYCQPGFWCPYRT